MDNTKTAVLGGGCFWCTEAAFEQLPGVLDVESGYAGGEMENPTYEQVSSGLTGHAEVIRVSYDPERVGYETLLDLFFKVHDPTTVDRQGADAGPQYRSIILYADAKQEALARKALERHAKDFSRPIVTQVQALTTFWPAEQYHQDFYRNNPNYGYCKVVVAPKIQKAKSFVELLPAP